VFDFALETMISQQLVGRGVRDDRVLGAFRKVPRQLFVPDYLESKAYEELDVPIGLGQTMSTPYAAARMLSELRLQPHHRVLEVGTGSGLLTAMLAALVREVCTVEILPELAARARKHLHGGLGLGNVSFLVGNGHLGWSEKAPFDAILVMAAADEVPDALLGQLRDGGRLVLAMGDELSQALHVLTRSEDGEDSWETVDGAAWPVLLAPLEPLVGDDDD
jgi:protein-L-isoaspartate(D-aspartate) O-methyltransferase